MSDPFALTTVYPDPWQDMQVVQRPLHECLADAIVALDANALLLPYATSPEALGKISETYDKLKVSNRLLIPAQAFREFLKNRPIKIGELHQKILDVKSNHSPPKKMSFRSLENLESYKKVEGLRLEIDELDSKYNSELQKLADEIKGWATEDPVTSIYKACFDSSCVIELTLAKQDVEKSQKYRYANLIPPGYKDQSKNDGGIGDLIIWLTLMQEAKARNLDVIFITGEKKTDWIHFADGVSFLRHELSVEFHRETSRTIHVMQLGAFLEKIGESRQVVSEVVASDIMGSFNRRILDMASADKVLYASRDLKIILDEHKRTRRKLEGKMKQELDATPDLNERESIRHRYEYESEQNDEWLMFSYRQGVMPFLEKYWDDLVEDMNPGYVNWAAGSLLRSANSERDLWELYGAIAELENL